MITAMSHTCIYVLDQDSALNFYVNKLGFKVHTDAPMGPGMRWLTITPPGQPEFEIILNPIKEGMGFNQETALQMRELVKKGSFGFAVWECDNLNATYEELKAKGVEFTKPPTKEFMLMRLCLKMIREIGFHSVRRRRRIKFILV